MKKRLVLFTYFLLLNLMNTCFAQECSTNIIYVKKSLINDIDAFRTENEGRFCGEETTENFIIDLDRMEENNVPSWLKDNSYCINFDESFALIEDLHSLDENDANQRTIILDAEHQIIIEKNYYGIAFNDLKIGLNDKIITKLPQSEYYNNYKRAVDKNIFHSVKLKSTDGFIFGESNFSTPLFLSILKKLNIRFGQTDDEVAQSKCYFQFTFINNDTKAVMKVTYKSQTLFYDFSDEPGKSKSNKESVKKGEIIKEAL